MAGKRASEISLLFIRKSVHYWWNIVSHDAWELKPDAFSSIQWLITEQGADYHVSLLNITEAPDT